MFLHNFNLHCIFFFQYIVKFLEPILAKEVKIAKRKRDRSISSDEESVDADSPPPPVHVGKGKGIGKGKSNKTVTPPPSLPPPPPPPSPIPRLPPPSSSTRTPISTRLPPPSSSTRTPTSTRLPQPSSSTRTLPSPRSPPPPPSARTPASPRSPPTPPPPPTVEESPVPDNSVPENFDEDLASQIQPLNSDAVTAARKCEKLISDLYEKLENIEYTHEQEQEIIDEISTQTSQLEIHQKTADLEKKIRNNEEIKKKKEKAEDLFRLTQQSNQEYVDQELQDWEREESIRKGLIQNVIEEANEEGKPLSKSILKLVDYFKGKTLFTIFFKCRSCFFNLLLEKMFRLRHYH